MHQFYEQLLMGYPMVLIGILWSCWGFIFLWGDPYEEHEVKVPPDLHAERVFQRAPVANSCNRAFTGMRMEQVARKLKSLSKEGAAEVDQF